MNRREALLRHARYYFQLVQQNRADLNLVYESDWGNISQAANTCLELEEWDLLSDFTDAVNDYWLRSGRWNDYVKFNAPLVSSCQTGRVDERLRKISQLAELEETRGNHAAALHWSNLLIESQNENGKDARAAVDALRSISRLAARPGHYHEAMEYLKQGISVAQRVGLRKEEVDLFFDLALVHKERMDFAGAQSLCHRSLAIARSLGYLVKEIDILVLIASVSILQNQPEAASGLYDDALARARAMGDTVREDAILAEITKVQGLIKLEEDRKRKIFISYNREDRSFVDRLANDLKARELPVWWDQWEIKVGDSIIQKVSDGIASSSYLIPVLSPHSVKSEWVQREIGSVLMKQLQVDKNITILPLLLADCEVPVLLREIKWADFRAEYEEGLQSLLQVFISVAR